MKYGIIGVILAVALAVTGKYETMYTMDAEIVRENAGITVLEDERGHIWEIDTEEEFDIGDNVVIVFDNHRTMYIPDDEIISVHKPH